MVDDVLSLVKDLDPGCFIDATFGSGGHSSAIKSTYPKFHIIGIDRDTESVENNIFDIEVYKYNFSDIDELVKKKKIANIRCILFDFGISNHQITKIERGFTFEKNSILDMRMDRDQELTAKSFLNDSSLSELTLVIKEYGEDRHSGRIAKEIINSRPIDTSHQLSEAISRAVPENNPVVKKKSVRRCFQAIRIYVNDELRHVESGVIKSIDLLASQGLIITISYHSLEDKIVKEIFSKFSQACVCSPKIPECVCDKKPILSLGKPRKIKPKENEISKNRKSKSAILRFAVKL